ncbi:hypothetical protein, partial [Pseudomonas amygdali]|uniref:hypothetical protein n=1 Tax=Pseudomonas amygdali TaxID=47877 RepID=UPI001C7F4A9E
KGGTGPPISKRRAEICPRNAKQGRQVEKNRLGNEDGANGLIFQRLLKQEEVRPIMVGLFPFAIFRGGFQIKG